MQSLISLRRLAFLASLALLAVTAPAQKQKRIKYDKELQAFFKEVDKSSPFFKVKGIEKEWKATKKALLKRAKKCKKEADFVELVSEAVRAMRDGHAGLVKVRPKMPKFEPRFYSGLALAPASQDRVVVVSVVKSLEKKVPIGAIVLKIDGKPAREAMEARGAETWNKGGFFSSPQRATFFEYRQPFVGKRGDKHVIEVLVGKKKRKVTLRANYEVKGWVHLYNWPKDMEASAKSVHQAVLEDGTGYVWLRRMDASAEEGIKKAIAAHPDCKAWIVDLRGNTGGGYDRSMKQTITGFGKKVAVILDAGAISAAETFARDLVNVCKARTFGARTAGSSSSKKTWTFQSGIATVRFSVRSRSGVGGKPIEFHGIQPDVPLQADPEQVAAGKNTEILTAQAWLAK